MKLTRSKVNCARHRASRRRAVTRGRPADGVRRAALLCVLLLTLLFMLLVALAIVR
ncbi:hypothetical protein AB3X52_17645 [Nocardioides sp. DS6]|uniref:Uncharacterized protein n=1 Tax=Nocardioides eburneus TaxID=3231482 RepID=A0ABV3T2L6_9ACTN